MKKTAMVLGLLASAALAAPAAQAQEVNPDLRCAAWAMVASSQEQDAGKKNALGFMMAYFMGRYEQATGNQVQTQINPQTMESLLGDLEEANRVCAPRATDFGQRVQQTLDGMQPPAGETEGR